MIPLDLGARNKPAWKPVLLLLLMSAALDTLAKFNPALIPIPWHKTQMGMQARTMRIYFFIKEFLRFIEWLFKWFQVGEISRYFSSRSQKHTPQILSAPYF